MAQEEKISDPLVGLKTALAKERLEKRAARRRVRELESELASKREEVHRDA